MMWMQLEIKGNKLVKSDGVEGGVVYYMVAEVYPGFWTDDLTCWTWPG